MRRTPLLLAAILAAFPGTGAAQDPAAPQWRPLPNAPVSGTRHEDIFFLNPSLGWVVNLSGEVHKTTDGGTTWRLAHQGASVAFRSVGFADSLHGWAGTVYSEHPLYETRDGGETWTSVPLPDSVKGICGLSVVNDSVVYGTGTFYQTSPLIKTVDGGKTWQAIDMRARATTMIDVRFFSRDSGFVTGGFDSVGLGIYQGLQGVILFTGDGGATWQRRHRSDSLESWFWKLSFPTRGTAYASMERFNKPRATYIVSSDSGRTWTERSFPGQSDVQGIGFATPLRGWAGTHDSSYATIDGGQTWSAFDFGPGADAMNRFRMFSDTLGYAVGRTVYKYSRSAAASLAHAAAARGLRVHAHPPRFRDGTSFAFTLARGATVGLGLYDMRGRRVLALPDRELPAGRQTLRLDGRDLPAGPYLYRLRAGGETASGEVFRLP